MRQKFPAGIGNRRFVFGLCLQSASEQRSAFCHKLCICDLKYILYQVGIIWVLQFRVKSGQKQSRGRPYFRHLTHNFDTCKKWFTWWLWSPISLFLASNSRIFWCNRTHPTNCKVSSRNYREELQLLHHRREGNQEDAADTRLFFLDITWLLLAKSCVLLCYCRNSVLTNFFDTPGY